MQMSIVIYKNFAHNPLLCMYFKGIYYYTIIYNMYNVYGQLFAKGISAIVFHDAVIILETLLLILLICV